MAEQALGVTVQIVTVVLVAALTLVVTRPLGDIDISAGHLIAACLHLAGLGIFFGALAVGVGAASGRPTLTRVVCGLAALVSYLVHALSAMVTWLEPLRPLSPFRWYGGDAPLSTGVHASGLGVLVAASVVVVLLGMVPFTRRDLR